MLEDRTTAPVLRGTHLTRTFGEGEMKTTALNDVSLELYAGQIALLMGPSGSGKSTLLAVLSGLLHPDSGQVLALGQDLWALSDPERERFRLRHCGFIFQGYNLFGALTARPPPGRRDARPARPGKEGPPAARPDVRRREAARGHRPGPHQGPQLLLRRR